jgi:hypothetical protein
MKSQSSLEIYKNPKSSSFVILILSYVKPTAEMPGLNQKKKEKENGA